MDHMPDYCCEPEPEPECGFNHDAAIRLECLRLALGNWGPGQRAAETIVKEAEQFADFVFDQEESVRFEDGVNAIIDRRLAGSILSTVR